VPSLCAVDPVGRHGRSATLSGNLENAAAAARAVAEEAAAGSMQLIVVGLLALLVIKLVGGFTADHVYERQYSAWLTDRSVPSGVRRGHVVLTAFLLIVMFPLTIYRFTASGPPAFLTAFPVGKGVFNVAAQWLDEGFESVYRAASGAFDGIRDLIRVIVEAFEVVLVATPWPVVMTVIIFLAWRVAGPRVAIFTTAVRSRRFRSRAASLAPPDEGEQPCLSGEVHRRARSGGPHANGHGVDVRHRVPARLGSGRSRAGAGAGRPESV